MRLIERQTKNFIFSFWVVLFLILGFGEMGLGCKLIRFDGVSFISLRRFLFFLENF